MKMTQPLAAILSLIIVATCSAAPPDTQPAMNGNVNPALPTIPDHTFTLTDFGGIGDGKTLNTAAFTSAIDKIKAAGGGHLVIPKGTFRTLGFTLCSNLDLHLDDGAVIQAPDNFSDYGIPDPTTLKTQADVRDQVHFPAPLISGRDLHDVAITGDGVIDGSGALWWAWSERASRAQPGRLIYPRQKMVVITGCDRMHVEGVTFRNSPMFHFVPTRVTDLLIEKAKFEAPVNAPNTDAMDPGDCTNMLIRDCDIDVGDDDVAIKSGGQHLLIEDCRVKHGHGISIGSGTTDGISDMLVRRCTFDGADNGIRIKSMRGAGGLVHDVRYTDITMKNVGNAIVLDLLYTDSNRPNFKGYPNKIPKIQDVLIDNVTVESAKNAGKIVGLPDSPFVNVVLRNVKIAAQKDFVIKNDAGVTLENVTRDIRNDAAGTGSLPPP
jgi:polygalacturonase